MSSSPKAQISGGKPAFVSNALRTTRSTFLQISLFVLHDFAAFGDQKIARFLAKQRNCSRFAVRSARVARRATATSCRLINAGVKFFFRQFRRCDYTVSIAFPQNSSEASAIGATKVRHKII